MSIENLQVGIPIPVCEVLNEPPEIETDQDVHSPSSIHTSLWQPDSNNQSPSSRCSSRDFRRRRSRRNAVMVSNNQRHRYPRAIVANPSSPHRAVVPTPRCHHEDNPQPDCGLGGGTIASGAVSAFQNFLEFLGGINAQATEYIDREEVDDSCRSSSRRQHNRRHRRRHQHDAEPEVDEEDRGRDGVDSELEEEEDRVERPAIPMPSTWDRFIIWKQLSFHKSSNESAELLASFENLDALEKTLVVAKAKLSKTIELVKILIQEVEQYMNQVGRPSRRLRHGISDLKRFLRSDRVLEKYQEALDMIPKLREDRKTAAFYRIVWDRKARKNKKYLKYLETDDEGTPAYVPSSSYTTRKVDSLRAVYERQKKYSNDLIDCIEYLLEYAEVESVPLKKLRDTEWKILHAFQHYVRTHRTSEGEESYARVWNHFSTSMSSISSE